MRRLLPCCLALSMLSGCGTSRLQTQVQIERITLPPELLSCADAPEPPAEPYTQADVAGYIVDLHSAGADCRERLARIAALQATPLKGSTP